MNLNKLKDKAQNAINAGRDKVKVSPQHLLRLIAGYKEPEQVSVLNTNEGEYEFLLSVCDTKSTGNLSVADISARFVAFVMNKDHPYEQRKKIWLDAPEQFVPTETYFSSFEGIPLEGEFSMYDDFYIDRGQDQDLRNLLDRPIFENDETAVGYGYACAQEMQKHFIDHCMDEGLFIINYDW